MIICPHLILRKENQILLLKRNLNAHIYGGHWHCPTGKIEGDETPLQAIIREAHEEVGITVKTPQFSTAVYLDAISWEDPSKRWQDLSLFFVHNLLVNEIPYNIEPQKHTDMGWFDSENLPDPMIPVVRQGILQSIENISYGELLA
ncbi:NUDIX domain-containing protein [Candidatus Bealeia paramacronuclearis]|uniref:NUDIX domain-containing protein n=1 Tax=Candidatus Bealeia paramacronuclearis TaxID=1921001 RepID=A0ABZ2C4D9_9PROT|nr:NUDIX domain-containing protein [Candidatus Bealeia paramacronuclearis]